MCGWIGTTAVSKRNNESSAVELRCQTPRSLLTIDTAQVEELTRIVRDRDVFKSPKSPKHHGLYIQLSKMRSSQSGGPLTSASRCERRSQTHSPLVDLLEPPNLWTVCPFQCWPWARAPSTCVALPLDIDTPRLFGLLSCKLVSSGFKFSAPRVVAKARRANWVRADRKGGKSGGCGGGENQRVATKD